MAAKTPAGQAGASAPRPRQLTRGAIVLWLIAAGMVILLLPLSLVASTIQDDAKRLNADLVSIQDSLTSVPTPVPEVQTLMTSVAEAQQQSTQIDAILPTITGPRANWPALMSAIANYDPNQIVLSALAQAENSVTISGKAVDDTTVVNYARALEGSGQFTRVVVQSIRVVATPVVTLTATAGATVTPTLTPTAAPTPTPTTDPRDQYEPDDTQSKPIFFGQPQVHNFYPTSDVDTARFLAKSGRTYRVSTTELAPGVDTVLTVNVGSLSPFVNDDSAPGVLNSEVVFQAPTGADVTAVIRVTNRGQFGPAQRYTLAVDEIVPTPSAGSPTPTATATPSPTPTPTSSPTPDQRDGYEPDDVDPKPIAIGETQLHNFFPDGDVDKVSFVAKLGRFYQALTSELALGVDTIVQVSQGGKQWINDDANPGTGSYESMVCFQAPADGNAVMTITNAQRQFGTAKTYKITVKEIADLTEPKCAQTTPVASLFRAPGLAAPNRRALLATLNVEFVIVAEIKVTAP